MSFDALTTKDTPIRASSVLKRNVKLYGAQHVFDGVEETCWNSDQGSPQWLEIAFASPVNVSAVFITFQGGFSGQQCELLGSKKASAEEGELHSIMAFEPEDVNAEQAFAVTTDAAMEAAKGLQTLRLLIKKSSDMYGRVTIYKLQVLGSPA